jgi:hypothetical protein
MRSSREWATCWGRNFEVKQMGHWQAVEGFCKMMLKVQDPGELDIKNRDGPQLLCCFITRGA